MDSMMTDDFDKMRERFHDRARNFRQDNAFDRWVCTELTGSAFRFTAVKNYSALESDLGYSTGPKSGCVCTVRRVILAAWSSFQIEIF